jgi:hypothetical protein
MNATRLLRDQHRELRALAHTVEHVPSTERLVRLEILADALGTHWRLASQHLHPLFEPLGIRDLDGEVARLRRLTEATDEIVALEGIGGRFSEAWRVLVERLERHIVDEETTVFPVLEARLSREALDTIGHEMRETIAEIENENWVGAPEAAWHTRP